MAMILMSITTEWNNKSAPQLIIDTTFPMKMKKGGARKEAMKFISDLCIYLKRDTDEPFKINRKQISVMHYIAENNPTGLRTGLKDFAGQEVLYTLH